MPITSRRLIPDSPQCSWTECSRRRRSCSDIVDPHGIQFRDAPLPRLKGLAKYAEKNPGIYRRIEVIARVGDKFRAIDLTKESARAAVLAAGTVREAYDADGAIDYNA